MPNTIPAAGEAMPNIQKLIDQYTSFSASVAKMKLVWLATDSPNFNAEDDLADVQNLLWEGLDQLQTIEKLFAAANDENIAIVCTRNAGDAR